MPDGAIATGPRTLRVPDGKASRVDRVVADATGLSRSYVQKLISDGRLTADGLALKSNAIVQPGSELRLDVPPVVTPEIAPAPEIPVHVVYEDDDLLIVDKPPGSSSIPRRATPPTRWSTRSWPGPTAPSTAASPASRGRGSSTASIATPAGS